jgi:ABC-type polysaccharide/polyol phosphate export permease
VIPHLLRIWFYLSPILYTASRFEDLPAWATTVYNLNPMVSILAVYRAALLGYAFHVSDVISAGLWAVGVAIVSIASFVRYEGKMARYL